MSVLRSPQPKDISPAEEEPLLLTRPRTPALRGAATANGTWFPGIKLVVVASTALLPRTLSKRLADFGIEVIPWTSAEWDATDDKHSDATAIVVDRHLDITLTEFTTLHRMRRGLAPIVECDLANAVASQRGLDELVRSLEPVMIPERDFRTTLRENQTVRVTVGALRAGQLLRIALDLSPWTIRLTIEETPLRINTYGDRLVVCQELEGGLLDATEGDRWLDAIRSLREGELLFTQQTSAIASTGAREKKRGEPESGPRPIAWPRPSAPRKPPIAPHDSGTRRLDRTGRRAVPAYGPKSELVQRREPQSSNTRLYPSEQSEVMTSRSSLEGNEDDEPLAPLALSTAFRVTRAFALVLVILGTAAVGVTAYLLTR